MSRFVRAAILALALSVLLLPAAASAHRDACHTWHACPPDAGSTGYVCGDLGYIDYCDQPPNTNTTLVDYMPPLRPLGPEIAPPPSDPPYQNPTGAALLPPPPPHPPIQPICGKDRLTSQALVGLATTDNDPRLQQGCELPITTPPLH